MEIRQKEESEEMVIGGRVNNKYLYLRTFWGKRIKPRLSCKIYISACRKLQTEQEQSKSGRGSVFILHTTIHVRGTETLPSFGEYN